MSCNEWKEYSLSELVEIIGGGTPKTSVEEYWNGTINWISIKDFNGDYKHILDTEKKITEIGLQKSSTKLLKEKDIIISARGTVGALGVIKKPMAFNQSCYGLRAKSNVNSDFIYYLLKNSINILKNNTHGSVFSTITKDTFNHIIVKIPREEEQESIANILSSLDDKIELNNEMNKTLEEMAQSLFKRWFVDFEFPNEDGQPYKSSGGELIDSELGMIPKGWEVGTLNDVAEFQNGYAFKSKELLDNNVNDCYHVFKMGHIKKGGGLNKLGTKSYIEKSKCENIQKYVIKKGDLLMCMTDMKSNVALLGHTALMDEDDKYILNQRVGLLRCINKEKMNYPYLYILTNYSDFIENLRSRANSGVQVNLSTKEIKETKILIPQFNIHKLFDSIAINICEKQFILSKENEKLSDLRDTLLPKLMNGEISLIK